MLSVFITPWMKPTFIHCAISAAWRSATRSQQRRGSGSGVADEVGVVARDRVLGELAHALDVAARGEELERADADVARRDARQHRAGQHASRGSTGSPVATTASARVVGMPSACMASPISTSRSIGPTAALPSPPRENGVRPEPLNAMSRRRPCAVDHLAEQQRAAVAELRREAAELVARVGLRDRLGAFGHRVAGEERGAGRAVERGDVEAELLGERRVEEQRLRRGHGFRAPRHREALRARARTSCRG